MDSVTTKKTLKVSRGFTYTYYVSPARDSKPTLLLNHGFPDDAHEWSDLIANYLVPAGYGVVAPDLLGYSGTSKPLDPAAFKWSLMAADLIEILDAEKLPKIISFGHDWGSAMAQAVYNLHPSRTIGLVMVNVTYKAPSDDDFDLDKVLAITTKVYGYGLLWYWKFFTADDAADKINADLPRFFDMMHGTRDSWLATVCRDGGAREGLEGKQSIEVCDYVTPEMKNAWVERIKRDRIDSPLCWYKSHVFGHQDRELDSKNNKVTVPSLYLAYDKDAICRTEGIRPPIKDGLLPQLEVKDMDGTHWGLVAKPKEFGQSVLEWLDKTYAGSKP